MQATIAGEGETTIVNLCSTTENFKPLSLSLSLLLSPSLCAGLNAQERKNNFVM
jgi:hypothetical protein